MTANGTFGSSAASATSSVASARAVRSRADVGDVGASPRTSRAAMPRRWRSFQRRSAAWRSAASSRQRQRPVGAGSTSSALGPGRAAARASGRRATRSGLRCSVSAEQPAGADERGTGAGPPRATRGTPRPARRRRSRLGRPGCAACSRPRSGSGVSDSQSSSSGSICCISRDEPGEAAGQLAHGGLGALGVGEAEALQPGLGRARAGQQLARRPPAKASSSGRK